MLLMRGRLTALLTMVVLLLATAAPAAFATPPTCEKGEAQGSNCGASLEHRANPSGEGNFGQCHKLGAIEGKESRTFNPSAQNTGEADCRTVQGREGSGFAFAVVQCGPGGSATAENTGAIQQLTLHTFAHCPG